MEVVQLSMCLPVFVVFTIKVKFILLFVFHFYSSSSFVPSFSLVDYHFPLSLLFLSFHQKWCDQHHIIHPSFALCHLHRILIRLRVLFNQRTTVVLLTWWNPAAETRPVLDSSSCVPIPTLPRTLATILLLAFSLFKLVAALSQCLCSEMFVFRKQKEAWRSCWIPTIG